MTDTQSDTTIPVEDVEEIERRDATRPWQLNEMTSSRIGEIDGIHRSVDTAHVPWGAVTPVDELDVFVTVNPRVMERRELDVEYVVGQIADAVEDDGRLVDYVAWEYVEPEAVLAPIDDNRARLRISWRIRSEGGDDDE